MTTRFLLTVALATFMAVQGLHAECWFSCGDGRPAAGPACHETLPPSSVLTDAHDCAEHAPLVALNVERSVPVMPAAIAGSVVPASCLALSVPLGPRSDGFIRSSGRPDLPTPLRN